MRRRWWWRRRRRWWGGGGESVCRLWAQYVLKMNPLKWRL
jgi:hypothetical protein